MRQLNAAILIHVSALFLVGASRICNAEHEFAWTKHGAEHAWVVARHKDNDFPQVHPDDVDLDPDDQRRAIALVIRVTSEEGPNTTKYYARVWAFYSLEDTDGDTIMDRYSVEDMVELTRYEPEEDVDKRLVANLKDNPQAGRREVVFQVHGKPHHISQLRMLGIPRRTGSEERAILCNFRFFPKLATDDPCEEPPMEDILEEEPIPDPDPPTEGPEYTEEP